jgi:hypothetical protein
MSLVEQKHIVSHMAKFCVSSWVPPTVIVVPYHLRWMKLFNISYWSLRIGVGDPPSSSASTSAILLLFDFDISSSVSAIVSIVTKYFDCQSNVPRLVENARSSGTQPGDKAGDCLSARLTLLT